MHAHVHFIVPVGLLLLSHVALMLIVNEVDYGSPRVTVVDIVSESGSIDNGQFDLELFLLELGFHYINLRVLFLKLLDMPGGVFTGGCELGGEEGIDEGRLAEAGLADDHKREVSTALSYNTVALVREVGDAARGTSA